MKWFDYQLLTEQECLLQCVHDFLVAYRRYCKEMDREENLMGFDKFDVERPYDFRHFKTFNIVIQYCDKNTILYSEFWDEAFRIAMRFDTDVYSPAFFGGDKILNWVRDGLENHKTMKLSNIAYFKPENYREEELQKEYYKYVYNHVKDRDGVWKRMVAAGDVPDNFLTNI